MMSYYSLKREERLEYGRQYREDNKDKIKEGKAKYRANAANKEKEKAYYKQYREANGQYIKEKIICDNCGCTISRNGIAEHKRSKKCSKYQKT